MNAYTEPVARSGRNTSAWRGRGRAADLEGRGQQVKFGGALEPDHVPQLKGDSGLLRAGTAYCVAYIRALVRRANEEVG